MSSRKLRRQLVSAIREDPDRAPEEKETGISWGKDTDAIQVYTAESGLMRRLARHPEFTLEWADLSTGPHETQSVTTDELPDDLGRRSVYSIGGCLPIGCLTVSGQPRTSSQHSQVVSPSGLLDLDGDGS